MVEYVGKIPSGVDILKILAKLLAEQEGVEIEYEILRGDEVVYVGDTSKEKLY